ncbi:MAG: prolipoprotein diacylglyceryl transferase [Candidatus Omnitrophica bacterium]|nr:prolipoprotein diacylglyceryl transferase [Candidatus Omnitrophota bacterium]
MHPILFRIGPITIYSYGLFVFLGVLAGYFISWRVAKREGFGYEMFSDIIFYTVLFGFLGAKLLFIGLNFSGFLSDPLSMIQSGFVFYGGFISGVVTLFVLSKKRKIKFLKIIDCFVVALPLSHAFGRIGCFFYGCCFGRPTNSFIGVLFPKDSYAGFSGLKVIPTQLISALALVLIFLLLLRLSYRKKFDGQILAVYLLVYPLFRFLIEFFRGDPRGVLFYVPTSQFLSLLAFSLGVILWKKLAKER